MTKGKSNKCSCEDVKPWELGVSSRLDKLPRDEKIDKFARRVLAGQNVQSVPGPIRLDVLKAARARIANELDNVEKAACCAEQKG